MAAKASYVLGVLGQEKVRLGAELGGSGETWSRIADKLPKESERSSGSSAAVDFALAPGVLHAACGEA